ncbi:MAG: hypothetical protein NHB14_10960 [Desulfosporosinus sp.]|nr:hypothetical protein [Desulfosporosinus sp.]
MLKENVARQPDEPVLINVHGKGAHDWELWLTQMGFRVVAEEEADVLLWVDPENQDLDIIATDPRCIVAGNGSHGIV